MTTPVIPEIIAIDLNSIENFEGRVVLTIGAEGKLNQAARRVNRLSKGALGRLVASERFEKLKQSESIELAFPAAMLATAVQVVKLDRNSSLQTARKAGATIAKAKGGAALLILVGNLKHAAELALGVTLRTYEFNDHKTAEATAESDVTLMVSSPTDISAKAADLTALAKGVFFTRDLTNEPANVL
ncbi:MAG: M17 family peptidase N-terminal domain-containing protein, partial [Paracoccaceae bacterium]